MAGESFEDVASVTGDAKRAGVSLSQYELDQLRTSDFRRLTAVVREHLGAAGVTEDDVLADLAASRRIRRRQTIG